MRCFSVDRSEKADKMELGKMRLAGNIGKIYFRGIIAIDEKFGSNDSSVQVYFGILFCCHLVVIALVPLLSFY